MHRALWSRPLRIRSQADPSIRRTPSTPISRPGESGPEAPTEPPGAGTSFGADEFGRAIGFPRGITKGPEAFSTGSCCRWPAGRADLWLRRFSDVHPLRLPRAAAGLPGALPLGAAEPMRSGSARLPAGTTAPRFISPRQVGNSLRPAAPTGYLTARRQRWGLEGDPRRAGVAGARFPQHRGAGRLIGDQASRSWAGYGPRVPEPRTDLRPVGQLPVSQRPVGQPPAGQRPVGQRPVGQRPAGGAGAEGPAARGAAGSSQEGHVAAGFRLRGAARSQLIAAGNGRAGPWRRRQSGRCRRSRNGSHSTQLALAAAVAATGD